MEDQKLCIQLFNVFDICWEGESIFLERQLTGKLKSLLEYFILNKSALIKPEQIINALWPENDYIDEKKVLQTYVHRLRNILSKTNRFHKDFTPWISIASVKSQYCLKTQENILFDTDEFIALINGIEDCIETDEIIGRLEAMGKIYSGHFLQDAQNEDFVQLSRNYYLNIYCKAFLICVNKLYELGNYDAVINYCEKFFVLDDVDEGINQIFLKALLKTGQTGYAVRHYGYMEKKLREELGIRPALALSSLYKEINGESVTDADAQVQKAALDKDYIRSIVHELLVQGVADQKEKDEIFLKVDFVVGGGAQEQIVREALQYALLNALNKDDLYSFIGKQSAVAVLYGRKDGYRIYKIMEERINAAIGEKYPEMEIQLDISVIDFSKVS